MAELRFKVITASKEDVTLDGVEPNDPDAGEAAAHLSDLLADETKHNGLLGWRVLAVIPLGD